MIYIQEDCACQLGKSHAEGKLELNIQEDIQDFPGGTVVKNPPAIAGDMGLSPGPGRSHMLQSN